MNPIKITHEGKPVLVVPEQKKDYGAEPEIYELYSPMYNYLWQKREAYRQHLHALAAAGKFTPYPAGVGKPDYTELLEVHWNYPEDESKEIRYIPANAIEVHPLPAPVEQQRMTYNERFNFHPPTPTADEIEEQPAPVEPPPAQDWRKRMEQQQKVRDLLYVRPYDLTAIEREAMKLCDMVFNECEASQDAYADLQQQLADKDRENLGLKRQVSAYKTIKESLEKRTSLAERKARTHEAAQHSVDSEREMNSILTEENESLQQQLAELKAENERLREALLTSREINYIMAFIPSCNDRGENTPFWNKLKQLKQRLREGGEKE